MRSFSDRIRHMIMFEVIALVLATTIASKITNHSLSEMGVLAVMMSLLAMSWNLVFNWLFDHWHHRMFADQERGVGMRVFHAALFELGLLLFGIGIVMAWLGIGFWAALVMDLGFAAFFLVYAFVFNWAYDLVFPVPVAKAQT